jgi:hypothetical protein
MSSCHEKFLIFVCLEISYGLLVPKQLKAVLILSTLSETPLSLERVIQWQERINKYCKDIPLTGGIDSKMMKCVMIKIMYVADCDMTAPAIKISY